MFFYQGNLLHTQLSLLACHCEPGERLWLQGKVALQTHRFRDATPQQLHPRNQKKNYRIFLKQLRPGINNSLTATDPFLPTTAWQCTVVCYSRSSQLGPGNMTGKYFIFIRLCLAFWVRLKLGSENMVNE